MTQPVPLDDELRLLVTPGGCLEVDGSASAPILARYLLAALGTSSILDGRHVAVIDWLPGLDWHVQVSQALAESLPGTTETDLWARVGPAVTAWLDRPTDAGMFRLPPAWGDVALVRQNRRWPAVPVTYTLRCRWSKALGRRTRRA